MSKSSWKEVARFDDLEKKTYLKKIQMKKEENYCSLQFKQKIDLFNALLPTCYNIIICKELQLIYVFDKNTYDMISDEGTTFVTLFDIWKLMVK